ncbi:MAG TPA: hypothetical protein VJ253_09185 [Dehalococcoidia bacterium]|nr:hypothetical protein [Dehalococcoidia bacterium]
MPSWISKLKTILGGSDPDYPRPALQEGEEIILEGHAARVGGLFGRRWGPLILTNRRLIWYEDVRWTWPLKRISGELALADIASVGKGNLLNFVFGGHRIQLRLWNGKSTFLYEGDGKLDEWITAIRGAMAAAEKHYAA